MTKKQWTMAERIEDMKQAKNHYRGAYLRGEMCEDEFHERVETCDVFIQALEGLEKFKRALEIGDMPPQ